MCEVLCCQLYFQFVGRNVDKRLISSLHESRESDCYISLAAMMRCLQIWNNVADFRIYAFLSSFLQPTVILSLTPAERLRCRECSTPGVRPKACYETRTSTRSEMKVSLGRTDTSLAELLCYSIDAYDMLAPKRRTPWYRARTPSPCIYARIMRIHILQPFPQPTPTGC